MLLGCPGPSMSARATQVQMGERHWRMLLGLHSASQVLFLFPSLLTCICGSDLRLLWIGAKMTSEVRDSHCWPVNCTRWTLRKAFHLEGRAASVTLQSYHSCGYKHSSGFLWWFKTVSHRILSRKKTFIQEFKGFFGWLVNSNWTKWLKCLASPPQPPKPPDQGRPFSRTPQTWAWQPGSSMAACFIWIQSYCCGLTAVCAQLLSCVLLFATSWPVAHQAPLSMEFSRQEYWSEVVISSSRGSSQPRNQTHISCVSCILRWILYHCATWEAP